VKEFQLSISYFKEGKFQEALTQINFCISKESNNPEFYNFRARVHSRLGIFDEALMDFDKIIGIDPYNPSYINDRAVVLHLMKKDDEAMAEFDRAINLDPKNPYRFSSRAYFRDRIGDLKGAIEDYEIAINLDPEDAVAYNNKGLVEEKLGYQQRAKSSFSKADELIGYNPDETSLPKPHEVKEVNNLKENQLEVDSKKLTFDDYLLMLKKVLTNPTTRQEFLGFLKSKIKSSSK
jgi:tetratricopeptide (TPR) repeat protein